jgi:hypothetical protein
MNNAALEISKIDDIQKLDFVGIDDRKDLPEEAGIYFVINDLDFIYLGITTKSLRQRWAAHHRFQQIKKIAPASLIFYCLSNGIESDDLLRLEKQLIQRLTPRLNSSVVPSKEGKKKQYLLEADNEEVDAYWKFIGISQEAWMSLSPTGRATLAWKDMFAKTKNLHDGFSLDPRIEREM